MWTVLFMISTVICGIGWAVRYVSTAAMIYYIEKKGYTKPNDEDIEECTQWAIRHIFKK